MEEKKKFSFLENLGNVGVGNGGFFFFGLNWPQKKHKFKGVKRVFGVLKMVFWFWVFLEKKTFLKPEIEKKK